MQPVSEVQLKRGLGTFDLAMIAAGASIGSGIFLTPSLIAHQLPSPSMILMVWVLGGITTVCGALTFAELGAMMPRAGGMYAYLAEAYGPLTGFLFGWAYFVVVNSGGIAALSIAFATYFGFFVPLDTTGIQGVALLGLGLLTLLNIYGVRAGSLFTDFFTILKLASVAGLIVAGIGWGTLRSSIFTDVGSGSFAATPGTIAAAMVGVLWSYGGWQHATFTAGEARNPARSVPTALIFGGCVVTLVYLLANFAYLSVFSPSQIAGSQRLAADALSTIVGPAGAGLIALAIFLFTFGSVGTFTLTVPRIYFAMAKDGLLPRRVAEVHPKFQTPAVAIAVQSLWAMVLILFWQTFDRLLSYVLFTEWIFFGLTGAAVIVLRYSRPDLPRPYRVPGYPLPPLLFAAVSLWFVINTLLDQPAQAGAGLAFLAIGIILYYIRKKRQVKSNA